MSINCSLNNSSDLVNEIKQFADFEQFKKHNCFFDIETTGLNPDIHHITIAGLYSNNNANIYIKGKSLHKLANDLTKHNYVVTFNGDRFDLNFMEKQHNIKKTFKSIDIMYLLRELGYRGRLKNIEHELGIARNDDVNGMIGKDAIGLWQDYMSGNNNSLIKLIKYNLEDIVNLEVLLNFVYYKVLDYPNVNKNIFIWKNDLMNKLNQNILFE